MHMFNYACSYAVEPPNKRHVGDSVNLSALSFVKRLSLTHDASSQCVKSYSESNFFDLEQTSL